MWKHELGVSVVLFETWTKISLIPNFILFFLKTNFDDTLHANVMFLWIKYLQIRCHSRKYVFMSYMILKYCYLLDSSTNTLSNKVLDLQSYRNLSRFPWAEALFCGALLFQSFCVFLIWLLSNQWSMMSFVAMKALKLSKFSEKAWFHTFDVSVASLYSFHTTEFLYPLKKLPNWRFYDVFRGYIKKPMAWNTLEQTNCFSSNALSNVLQQL